MTEFNCAVQEPAIKECLHTDLTRKFDPLRHLAFFMEPLYLNKRAALSILLPTIIHFIRFYDRVRFGRILSRRPKPKALQ